MAEFISPQPVLVLQHNLDVDAMLGQLPKLIAEIPYLVWQEDPKLSRYIRSLAPENAALSREQIVQVLVQRRDQLPPDRTKYREIDQLLSGCLTSIIAQIVFTPAELRQLHTQIWQPLQQHSLSWSVIDVYALGLEIISQPELFLQGFSPPVANWHGSLRSYCQQRFSQQLIDRLRSLPNFGGFKRTNLGLLARSSPKLVRTALVAAGERESRLARLVLIHQYLQAAVEAREFSTRNPQTLHYDNLFARSREQCERVNLLVTDRNTFIELLTYMGNTLRRYLQPPQVSFDQPIREHSTPLEDFIPDQRLSPAEQLAVTDGQQQTSQFQQLLLTTLGQLPVDRASLLLWLYGLRLTQAEAALELGMNQTTVKYRRDRSLTQLAQNLHQMMNGNVELSIETLANIVQALIVVCEDHYPAALLRILETIQTKFDVPDVKTEQLCQCFVTEIQRQWRFEFKPHQLGQIKAQAFVQNHLNS